MGEIIELYSPNEGGLAKDNVVRLTSDIVPVTESFLTEIIPEKCRMLSMPISQIATLGSGVASLIPAFRKVEQTISFNGEKLYRLANAEAGDVLKQAKNGNFWGAFKTTQGKSKMLQLQDAGALSGTSISMLPPNPAMIMVAVALFSIEQELGKIEAIEKQVLSFLSIEQEAEIEAGIKTLTSIATNYKFSWDNERYVASHHQQVCDIKLTARKNMDSYRKQVAEVIKSNKFVTIQSQVKSALEDLLKKFQYYRMSLYEFSLASFLEIMLSENYSEEYIQSIKCEIEELSIAYRRIFEKGSLYLEKMGDALVEAKLLIGVGTVTEAIGKLAGKIPLVKESPVETFFKKGGTHLKENSEELMTTAVRAFADLNSPNTQIIINKMDDMIAIYNHTSEIYFDNENVYLIAG